MANNVTFASSGTGGVPNATVIRTRDNGSGQQVQVMDVAPMVPTPVTGGQYALTVTTTTAVTLTVPSGATHAVVSIDTSGGNIRWTRDGQVPTASVGHLMQAGDALEADNITSFRMIGIGSSAIVQVSYHKYV